MNKYEEYKSTEISDAMLWKAKKNNITIISLNDLSCNTCRMIQDNADLAQTDVLIVTEKELRKLLDICYRCGSERAIKGRTYINDKAAQKFHKGLEEY